MVNAEGVISLFCFWTCLKSLIIKRKKKMPIYTQSIDYRVFLNGGFGYKLESTLMRIKDIWRLLLVEKDGKTKFIEMNIWNVEFKLK